MLVLLSCIEGVGGAVSAVRFGYDMSSPSSHSLILLLRFHAGWSDGMRPLEGMTRRCLRLYTLTVGAATRPRSATSAA